MNGPGRLTAPQNRKQNPIIMAHFEGERLKRAPRLIRQERRACLKYPPAGVPRGRHGDDFILQTTSQKTQNAQFSQGIPGIFISKGNVMDLAVAVIIGAAFSNIVNSLVKDIVNPILGVLVGRPDFTNLFVVLKPVEGYTGPQTYEALVKAGATVFGYGAFLTAVVQFLLLAFVIFWLIKVVTTIRKRLEAEAAKLLKAEEEKKAAAPAPPPRPRPRTSCSFAKSAISSRAAPPRTPRSRPPSKSSSRNKTSVIESHRKAASQSLRYGLFHPAKIRKGPPPQVGAPFDHGSNVFSVRP